MKPSIFALAFAIFAQSAQAQTVGVSVGANPGASGVSGAAARGNSGVNSLQFQGLSTKVGLTATPGLSKAPALSAPRPSVGASVIPVAVQEGVHPEVISMVEGFALPGNSAMPQASAPPASSVMDRAAPSIDQGRGPRGASIDALATAVKPEAKSQASPEWSIKRLFDGMGRRRDLSLAGPVAAGQASVSGVPALAKAVPAMSSPKTEVAAPQASEPKKARGWARIGFSIFAAAVVLGLSSLAVATIVPAAATVATVSFITTIHPVATAAAAAAGAAYGLIAAQGKDGAAANTGEIVASVIRYGLLGGAGMFLALDLTQAAFIGFAAIAAKPVAFSLATAALGQSAFQGKFADPATTSADRVMGTFPAVAAALGLGAAAFFAPVTLPFGLAVAAMSLTGVAAAVFAAFFKPGVSAADGPAKMAKGFVLQSLMSGLALSVTAPYLMLPLAALAAWGFWGTMSTAAAEVEAALPEGIRSLWRR